MTTKQATHTPGPWKAIIESKRGIVGETAMVSTGAGKLAIDAAQSADSWAETAANAKLIAAAPDLLEACQYIQSQLDLDEPSDWQGARAKLRAAIAKATGDAG